MPDLKDLQEKIDAAQEQQEGRTNPEINPSGISNMNRGMQILTEMIGIMIASGLLGYGIDYALGTGPAGLLILLSLGIITFFYKLIKMAQKK